MRRHNSLFNINSARQSKLYHKDSCPNHILLSNSVNGSQLTHSQHVNDNYYDLQSQYDNDSVDDLYIPTPPSDSSYTNTQISINSHSMSLSPSHLSQISLPFTNLSIHSNSLEISPPRLKLLYLYLLQQSYQLNILYCLHLQSYLLNVMKIILHNYL